MEEGVSIGVSVGVAHLLLVVEGKALGELLESGSWDVGIWLESEGESFFFEKGVLVLCPEFAPVLV